MPPSPSPSRPLRGAHHALDPVLSTSSKQAMQSTHPKTCTLPQKRVLPHSPSRSRINNCGLPPKNAWTRNNSISRPKSDEEWKSQRTPLSHSPFPLSLSPSPLSFVFPSTSLSSLFFSGNSDRLCRIPTAFDRPGDGQRPVGFRQASQS